MKKIGIVGGLGPESTLEYYRGIIAAFHEHYETTGFPEMSIESCNIREMLTFSENNDWPSVAKILTEKFELLRKSGCDFGVIASNTPHIVFDDVKKNTTLPLYSIIEAASEYAVKKNLSKLCLLGTSFTMRSDLYHKAFTQKNIEIVVPDSDDIDYLHEKIFSELELAIIKPDTKEKFIAITNKVVEENNCDGAIMGCTELPLILKPEEIDVEYIDTTAIHIAKVVEMCQS